MAEPRGTGRVHCGAQEETKWWWVEAKRHSERGLQRKRNFPVENADALKAGEATGASTQEGQETVITYLGNGASEQQ